MTTAAGEPDFRRFFADTYPRILARALMLSGSRHDAEDAVQEGYVEALRHWDRIGVYDAPDAWVYRVVRQRLSRAASRWRRQGSLEAMELAAWRAASGGTELAVEARLTLEALAHLPERQRIVMVMYCLQGMNQREIANELALTGTAVRQRIFKARRALERTLNPERDDRQPDPAFGQRTADGLSSAGADWPAQMLVRTETWLHDMIASHDLSGSRLHRAVLARMAERPRR